MQTVNVKRVFLFLGLTFSLTWGFEYLVSATLTQSGYLETKLHPLGMFFPAFSALLLQIFVFRDSPIYYRTNRDATRWVFFSYLLLTVLYGVLTMLALSTSIRTLILQGVGGILVTLWTLLVFFIYGRSTQDSLKRVGLQLGNRELGVRFVAGTVLFLLAQAALNYFFDLGAYPGLQEEIGGVPIPSGIYPLALLVFFLISVVGTPLSGLATVFGEEYGWRGFLQGELVKMGPLRGVFLVGVVWGLWHFPIVISGVHTYPPTWIGLSLSMIFFILTGFVFSYAVMKTNSIWVVAFMHGVLNSIYTFTLNYLVQPDDKLLSFGLGIFGLICLAAIVLQILRDPIWRVQPN